MYYQQFSYNLKKFIFIIFFFQEESDNYKTLQLNEIYFNKNELTSDWYKDQAQFKKLILWRCKIHVIHKNAFNVKPFRNLRAIYINIDAWIEFKAEAFNGLSKLEALNIVNGKIISDYQVFASIANNLEDLLFKNIDNMKGMYNFIGGTQMTKLDMISMRNVSFYRIITPHSITNTQNLRILSFRNCEIEAIMDGSFDHLADTLQMLLLWHNKLKTLSESLLNRIGHALVLESLVGNPWKCDCPLLNIKTKYNVRVCADISNDLQDQCIAWRPTLMGHNSVVSRKCFDHYGTNTLRINYLFNCEHKFSTHDKIVYIKCADRTKYFVVITFNDNQKFSCLSATAKYAAFSTKNVIPDSGVFLISVLHKNVKSKVWPFHIMSITVLPASNGWITVHNRLIIIAISLIVSTIVFILFTLLGIYLTVKNQMNNDLNMGDKHTTKYYYICYSISKNIYEHSEVI